MNVPFLLSAAALLPGLWLTGCREAAAPAPRARPNIVLISIDSLRADHLGCYGYERDTSPAIDRLASQGILFENAVSSSSWTLPAHAAAFTGLPDFVHRVERTGSRLGEEHRTLAEQLQAAGYQTAGFWSGPFLDPSFGLSQGFDEYIDCRSPFEARATDEVLEVQRSRNVASHRDVTSPKLLAEVSEWIANRRREPFLLFVHMWDVHYDYIPPPPYDTRFGAEYSGPANGRKVSKRLDPNNAADVEHTIALYDGEIAWTDHHVGKILEALEGAGLEDRTAIFLTADHGEEFFEHAAFGHRRTLFEESIHIPLIVRLPGGSGAGTRHERVVSIMDIAPTALELAGVPALENVVGSSLLHGSGSARGPLGRIAVSDIDIDEPSDRGPLLSVRSTYWKLLVRRRDGVPLGFYDLVRDPGEQNDLLGAPGGRLEQALGMLPSIRERLAALRELHAPSEARAGDDTGTELAPELEAQLRSLGYIGDED